MINLRQLCRRSPWFTRAVAVLASAGSLIAATPAEPILVTSASKQFIVRGKPQTSALSSTDEDAVFPEPALLVMVCERVRLALLQELSWGATWRDNIFINVRSGTEKGARPTIDAIPRGIQGWQYRVDLPEQMSRRDFLGSIIEVTLLEYANRGAKTESIELPPWLIEGMTEYLIHGPLAGMALQAASLQQIENNPVLVAAKTIRRNDVQTMLRNEVQKRGALTFDQLNWPEYEDERSAAAEAYRLSSHLFVRELLRLKNGPACMAGMLAILPEHLNPQLAFLRAFDAHFTRMLDVEKWWSLMVVQTKAREQSVLWSAVESQARLEEILYTPMQVQISNEELPHTMPVSLQTVINEWGFQDQDPVLRRKINQFHALRARVPQDYVKLLDDYRAALERYVAARQSKKLARRDPSSHAVRTLLKEVSAELDYLDTRRAELNKQVKIALLEKEKAEAASAEATPTER